MGRVGDTSQIIFGKGKSSSVPGHHTHTNCSDSVQYSTPSSGPRCFPEMVMFKLRTLAGSDLPMQVTRSTDLRGTLDVMGLRDRHINRSHHVLELHLALLLFLILGSWGHWKSVFSLGAPE